jgi:hypothetical protein
MIQQHGRVVHYSCRSNALDPELLRKTACLACEREILEFSAEQNWRDARNDHFRSAFGTCRRRSFRWQFLACHVISFHPRDWRKRDQSVEGRPVGEGFVPNWVAGLPSLSPFCVPDHFKARWCAPTMRRAAFKSRHDGDAPRGKRRGVADPRPTKPVVRTRGFERG